MNEQEKLSRARRQVAAIKGFYVHLAIFLLVNGLLIGINWAAGPPWWAQWPFLGWGAGVAGHAIAVFGRLPGAVSRWEEKKLVEVKRRLDEADKPAG